MKLINQLLGLLLVVLASCTAGTIERENAMFGENSEFDVPTPSKNVPGWSASGILTTPNAAGFTPAKEVNLQQEFEDAGEYTFQFDLIVPNPVPALKQARAKATIQCTVAGNTITRVLDIGNGTSITINAKSVRLSIVDNTINFAAAAYDYRAVVTVTPGTRPFSMVPPVTAVTPQFNVLFGAPLTLPVPQGRGISSVSVVHGSYLVGGVQTNLAYSDVVINQIDNAFNILASWKAPSFGPQWMPLLPGVRFVVVGTNVAATSIETTIIWGVDG